MSAINANSQKIVDFCSKTTIIKAAIFVLLLALAKKVLPTDLAMLWMGLSIIAAAITFKDEKNFGYATALFTLIFLNKFGFVNNWSLDLIPVAIVLICCYYGIYATRNKNIWLGLIAAIVLGYSVPELAGWLYNDIPFQQISNSLTDSNQRLGW